MTLRIKLIVLFAFAVFSYSLNAQETLKPAANDPAELAKKLANPVASLISVPLQNNTDVGIGVYHGYKRGILFQLLRSVTLPEQTLNNQVLVMQ